MTDCKHPELKPKQHPEDKLERPACTTCGKFVVRGELHITVPLKGAFTRG
jgi:hypothetical protein